MQIQLVNYQRTFNLGSYESVRIGAEVMVNVGEDAKQALAIAKNFVEEFQKENHPHTYGHDSTPDIPIIPKNRDIPDFDTVKFLKGMQAEKVFPESLEEQIKSCTDLKVLESYKFIVKGKPELEQIYELKRYELNANNADKAYPIKINKLQ